MKWFEVYIWFNDEPNPSKVIKVRAKSQDAAENYALTKYRDADMVDAIALDVA